MVEIAILAYNPILFSKHGAKKIGLVELSVSHYLLDRYLEVNSLSKMKLKL